MQTKVYVHGSKESMREHGREIGLTGEALNMFAYTGYEVELTVDVNEQTGESVIVAVDGRRVAALKNAESTEKADNSVSPKSFTPYIKKWLVE